MFLNSVWSSGFMSHDSTCPSAYADGSFCAALRAIEVAFSQDSRVGV
jgi:hypothetical protein